MHTKRTYQMMVLVLVLVTGLAATLWGAGTPDTAASAGPVKLVHYTFPAGNVTDGPEVFTKINEILRDKINVEVDFRDVPGAEYAQKIQVVINSGEPYDVCFTSTWRNNYYQNVARGAYTDLTDILPQYAPDLYKDLNKYWPAAKVNGKIYAVINEQIMARSRMTTLPHDIVEKAGIDIMAYSRRALAGEDIYALDYEMRKKIEPVATGDYVYTEAGLQIMLEAYLMDAPIDARVPGAVRASDAALKVFNQFDSAEFKELLNYNQRLLKEKLIRNLDLQETADGYRKMRAGGKIITPVAAGGTFKPGGEAEEEARWQYLYLQQPMTKAFLTTPGIIATMLACSSTSANPVKVVEYFQQLNTEAVYMLFHYGIKGKHYDITADGYLDQFKNTNYMRGVAWSCGSAFLPPPLIGQPKDVWVQTKDLNENSIESPLLGFAFNPTPVQGEIGQVISVSDEYVASLLQGKRPVTEYQDYLNKLKAAGSDKIMAELQKQINAWKAAK